MLPSGSQCGALAPLFLNRPGGAGRRAPGPVSWAAWRRPRVVTARAGHPRATAQQSQTLQPDSGGGLRGWARLRPAAQQPVHRGRTVTLASGDGASTRSWSCDTCVTQVAARLRGEQGHRQAGPPLQTLGVRPARGLSSGLRQQRSTLTVKGLRWGQKAAPGQGCVDTQGAGSPQGGRGKVVILRPADSQTGPEAA